MSDSKRVILGKLGAPYGVKGWLKVTSYTDPISNILDYADWQLKHQNQWRAAIIEHRKVLGNGIAIKLKGVDDRDAAQLHTHDLIAINQSALPTVETNEYYWHELLGVTVETDTGVVLGKIIEMKDTGANDVMIIKGDKRHLVPFIDHVLKSVDIANQKIIVDWDHEF